MVTQSHFNQLLLNIVIPLSLTGCVFGENKQFFEASSNAATAIGSVLPGGGTTGTDPTSTPSGTPSGTPSATATPVPTSTPIGGGTPTPSPTAAPSATPAPTSTPAPTATPIASATPSPTPECTVATTSKNLRIMFMIDNSGSTNTTDPAHNYRVKTIQDFLGSYGSHTNLTYSFGYFSGTTSPEWDMVRSRFQSSTTNIFGDAVGLSNALAAYQAINSSGNTPYSAAFAALKSEVRADEAAGTKQDYVVVFMSDGQPTDISGDVHTAITSMVDQLRAEVQTNGSRLTVSSVYFGPSTDSTSIGNLQTMATEGSGQFVDTNVTQTISINDIITVPSCH